MPPRFIESRGQLSTVQEPSISWRLSRGRPRLSLRAVRIAARRETRSATLDQTWAVIDRDFFDAVGWIDHSVVAIMLARKRSRKSERGRGDSLPPPPVKPIAPFFIALPLCTTCATLPWNLLGRYVFYESCSRAQEHLATGSNGPARAALRVTFVARVLFVVASITEVTILVKLNILATLFFENNATQMRGAISKSGAISSNKIELDTCARAW